ncbi:hypothetical protein WR25_16899 [Diploscapter pachys]|uniref:Uncharacterized protein n=1 Tax=Diploscapter pachys TaxID=2018661 RepID=A0A2A2LJZ3_9BILA|nr:hypothetical protein WR25_16899 [Diploscapter pachys]
MMYGMGNNVGGSWYGNGPTGGPPGRMTGPVMHQPAPHHIHEQGNYNQPYYNRPNGMPPNMGNMVNPPPGFPQSYHEPPQPQPQPSMGSSFPPAWNIYNRPPVFSNQSLEMGPETSHAPQQHQSNSDNVWQNPPSSQPPSVPVRDTGIGVWGDPRQQRPIQRWSQPGPSFEAVNGYQAPFGWEGVPQEASFKAQQPNGTVLTRAVQSGYLPKSALSLYQQGFRRQEFDKLLAQFEQFEATENTLRQVDEFLTIHPRDSISRNNRDDLARKAENIRNEMQTVFSHIFGSLEMGPGPGMGYQPPVSAQQNGYHPGGVGMGPAQSGAPPLVPVPASAQQYRGNSLPSSVSVSTAPSTPPTPAVQQQQPPSTASQTAAQTVPTTQQQQTTGTGSVPAASRLSQWTKKNAQQNQQNNQNQSAMNNMTQAQQQQYQMNINQQAAYGQYGQNAYQMQGGTQQGGQPQQAYGNPNWMPQGGQHGGAGRMQQQQQPNGYDNPLENSFQGMNLGGPNNQMMPPNSPWNYPPPANGLH